MKSLNFRLSTTQATAGLLVGALALFTTACLALIVFKGFDRKQMVIPYNEKFGMSAYRKPLVYVATPVALVLGLTGGILGFRSLGHQRNTKQGHSWLGLLLGAMAVATAPVMFYAWQRLAEPVILAS